MDIRILVFAHLKELIGSGALDMSLEDGATGDDLLHELETTFPQIKTHRKYLKLSMNGEYIDDKTPLQHDAEIAIFPPVSGG